MREPEELNGSRGHLAGIIHISIAPLATRLGEWRPENDQEIVTICRSGARAHTGAQILMQAGFSPVEVLRGGMMAWRDAGYGSGL